MTRLGSIAVLLVTMLIVPAVSAQTRSRSPTVQLPGNGTAAEATATFGRVLDALTRGDDAAVADDVIACIPLSRDKSLLYARRLILGSQLDWQLNQRFGADAARSVIGR